MVTANIMLQLYLSYTKVILRRQFVVLREAPILFPIIAFAYKFGEFSRFYIGTSAHGNDFEIGCIVSAVDWQYHCQRDACLFITTYVRIAIRAIYML